MVPRLKAFVVENEVSADNSMSSVLRLYFPEIHLLGFAGEVENAIVLIRSLKPDIVFLDIELKNGCGFQIVEHLWKNYNFILTSYVDRYAFKAISFDVTAYLLKPLILEDVLMAVNKVKQKLSTIACKGSARNEELKNKQRNIKILALPSMDKIELIEKKDIIYLKAKGRYTSFSLVGGATKLSSRNLGEFQKLLDSKMFFRIHHSFIVNILYVRNINKTAGNYLELKTGSSIPVAKRKLDSLNRFLRIK